MRKKYNRLMILNNKTHLQINLHLFAFQVEKGTQCLAQKYFYLSFFMLCFISGFSFAQNGEIAGYVRDFNTKEPIAFANVILAKTKMGASTDENGKYLITQVPAGEYTLQVNMMGYQKLTMQKVRVSTNRKTQLDFFLSSEAVTTQPVMVVATKPAVDVQVSSSAKVTTSNEVRNLPMATKVTDLIGLQSGVVKDGKNIHIRGGRSDEVLYLIDGVPANNPITGVGSVEVDLNQIEEVEIMAGGFDAKYGNANSGIINIVTKSGRERYNVDLVLKSDQPWARPHGTNYDYGYLGLSGPMELFDLIGLPGTSGFTLSSSYSGDDTYYNIGGGYGDTKFGPFTVPNRQVSYYNFSAQLNYQPLSGLKLKFQYQTEKNFNKDYNWSWKNIPQYLPVNNSKTDRLTGIITHTLDKNTYYQLSFAYTKSSSQTSLADLDNPINAYGYETVYYTKTGKPVPKDKLYLYSPDSIDFSRTQSVYKRPALSKDVDLDGFIDEGVYTDFYKSNYETANLKYDFTTFFNYHKFEAGFELAFSKVNRLDITNYGLFFPFRDTLPGEWPEYGSSRWYFNDIPWRGGFYIQDRIEYAGMFINVGARGDFYVHGKKVNDPDFIRAFNTATGEKVSEFPKTKLVWSPRLGLSIPADIHTKLFFNYGYFVQAPGFAELYRDPFLSGTVGNPNLEPRKMINYEVGIETEFITNYVLNVKLYGKDYGGEVGARLTETTPARYLYENTGFGSSRGFEIELRKVYNDYFSFTANYTYLMARGFDLTILESYERGSTVPPPVREQRVGWDINHNLKLMFNFEIPPKDPFSIFGLDLNDFGLYLLATSNFGRPYTPTIPNAIYVENNSSTGPHEIYTDGTIYKGFTIGATHLVAFLEINNLFNIRNIYLGGGFNTRTGEVVNLGDLEGSSDKYMTYHNVLFNRANQTYSPETTFKLGLRIEIR